MLKEEVTKLRESQTQIATALSNKVKEEEKKAAEYKLQMEQSAKKEKEAAIQNQKEKENLEGALK